MLDKLKQKISAQFPGDQEYQACYLFDLIQNHINNQGLEGEEIAKIIIAHLRQTKFLEFNGNYFTADTFKLLKQG